MSRILYVVSVRPRFLMPETVVCVTDDMDKANAQAEAFFMAGNYAATVCTIDLAGNLYAPEAESEMPDFIPRLTVTERGDADVLIAALALAAEAARSSVTDEDTRAEILDRVSALTQCVVNDTHRMGYRNESKAAEGIANGIREMLNPPAPR